MLIRTDSMSINCWGMAITLNDTLLLISTATPPPRVLRSRRTQAKLGMENGRCGASLVSLRHKMSKLLLSSEFSICCLWPGADGQFTEAMSRWELLVAMLVHLTGGRVGCHIDEVLD